MNALKKLTTLLGPLMAAGAYNIHPEPEGYVYHEKPLVSPEVSHRFEQEKIAAAQAKRERKAARLEKQSRGIR